MDKRKFIKFKINKKYIKFKKFTLFMLKTKHLLNFFFGNLKNKQLFTMYKTINKKKYLINLLIFLEFRLNFILIKSHFMNTGAQAKQFIKHSNVFVNSKCKKYPFQILKLNDIITLNNFVIHNYKQKMLASFFQTGNYLKSKYKNSKVNVFKKLSYKQVFIYTKFPKFLEINYRTFTIKIASYPTLNEYKMADSFSLYD